MPTHLPTPQILLLSLILLTTPTLSFIPIHPFPSSLPPHLFARQATDTAAAVAVAPTTAAIAAPTTDTTLPTTTAAAVIDTVAPAAAPTTLLPTTTTAAVAIAPTAPAAAPTAIAAPVAPPVAGQVSPVTTYQVYEYKANAAPVQMDVVYTQVFAGVPDQWPGPSVGKIGLGRRLLRRGLEMAREAERGVEEVLKLGDDGDEGEGKDEGEEGTLKMWKMKGGDSDLPVRVEANGARGSSGTRFGAVTSSVCVAATVVASFLVAGALP